MSSPVPVVPPVVHADPGGASNPTGDAQCGGGGLRERKKAATRQLIADVALKLAMEHGPSSVTVEDIAAAAEVSPRTVFNYFSSKEEAILGIDPDARAERMATMRNRPAGESPVEVLRHCMRFASADRARKWRMRAVLARQNQQLHNAYLANYSTLENGLTEGLAARLGVDPRHDVYPRLVVTVALAAMRVAIDHALDSGTDEELNAAIHDAFSLVAAGFDHPEARGATPSRVGGAR